MGTSALIAGERYIKGLDKAKLHQLKTLLTLPNPRYQQALHFSKSRNPQYACANIPQTISFYQEDSGVLLVPRGVACRVDKTVYNVVKQPVVWPEPKLTPREWQAVELAQWSKHKGDEHYDATTVSPPGSGKTCCGLFVAAMLGQRTLVLVHTDAIMRAWISDISEMFGDEVKPGIIKGQKFEIGQHITIAMVQTLRNKDVTTFAREFGLVIADEAQHVPSLTIYTILKNSESAFRFGITATPERGGRLENLIEWCCGPVHSQYDKSEQDTVPLKIFKVQLPFELRHQDDPIELRHSTILLRQAATKTRLYGVCSVVQQVLQHPDVGGPVLVVAQRTKYCKAIQAELLERGIAAEIFHSNMNRKEREDLLTRAKDGQIPVLIATVQMIAEGCNIPCLKHLVLAQTFSNAGLTRQVIGRVERKHPTKTCGYVWDLVDSNPDCERQYRNRLSVYEGQCERVLKRELKPLNKKEWKIHKCQRKPLNQSPLSRALDQA